MQRRNFVILVDFALQFETILQRTFKGFGGTIVASCNVICEPELVLFETDDRMRQMKGRHGLFCSVGRCRSKKC